MDKKKVKVGVISDTHLPGNDERIRKIAAEHFADADIILHAGDLVDLSVLEAFAGKEVKAVCGNMDYPSVKEQLPQELLFEINGFKFGLIHGWGAPWNLEEKILAKLGKVDCIIYGHTHKPMNSVIDGVLFFNPGSPTDKRFASHKTIGILEIDKGVSGRITNV